MRNIKIYNYTNYKKYTNDLLKNSPQQGRGQLSKIANFLGVHSTLVSQVLRGPKDFTLEQAHKISEFLGLTELETEYYMTLVQIEKAGSYKLKGFYQKQLSKLQNKFGEVSSRVVISQELQEEDKALYYSDWGYMATWLSTSIEGINSVEKISSFLGIPNNQVSKILEFLIRTGLCTEKDGLIKIGIPKTHLDSSSPLVKRHHINWRLKAIESFAGLSSNELAFTAPLTVSHKDFLKIKSDILEFIEKTSVVVSKSPAEKLSCLNIDLFDVKK